jgi:RNA polymerase sigma-70 factor (ECF subfamily)
VTPPPSSPLLEGEALAAAADAAVVQQALTGHEAAAREIVRRFERPVFNLIDRLVLDRSTAEDLCQDTFAKVFRALHTFDTRLRFSAWILRVANNTAIDYLRRRRPALVPLDAVGEDELPLAERIADPRAPTPEQIVQRRDLAAALDAALDRIRPEYRRVLVLRYRKSWTTPRLRPSPNCPWGRSKPFCIGAARRSPASWAPRPAGALKPGPPCARKGDCGQITSCTGTRTTLSRAGWMPNGGETTTRPIRRCGRHSPRCRAARPTSRSRPA